MDDSSQLTHTRCCTKTGEAFSLARFRLRLFGTKVTFVRGKLDAVTELGRVRALAEEIGATVIETPDTHSSCWRTADGVLGRAARQEHPRREWWRGCPSR